MSRLVRQDGLYRNMLEGMATYTGGPGNGDMLAAY